MMCNTLRLTVLAVGLVSFSAWAQLGLAAPTVYFARDNSVGSPTNSQAKFNHFTGTLNSFGVDDIESAVGLNPTLTFGATGITAGTQGVLAQNAPGFQIDDQALLELETVLPDPNAVGPISTTFSFSQHITAFGVFVIQGGDFGNNNPTTFRLRDTSDNSFVDVPVQVGPGWGLTNVFFLGVADTVPFDEVEIIESIDVTDGMLYDNIVAGFVPEPGSLALVMLGGACIFGHSTRLRRG